MQRILEPELMDDEQQAAAYAAADFSLSNQWFAGGAAAAIPAGASSAVDLGCGPADAALRLARARPALSITAVDGAAAMIRLAEQAVTAAGAARQVRLVQARLPGLPLPANGYDAILSKDLLHHLPDPQALWQEARRLGRPGALVYVMDLFRPESPEKAWEIVENAAGDAGPLLKRDFFNSLCAAFTPDEARQQLRQAGLECEVRPVSERHMVIEGTLRRSV